jgi:16S rRNA (guanine527-N7)-methyltransferase
LDILQEKLERAARALEIELEEGMYGQLGTYLEELFRWNRAYNLVGRKTTWEGLIEHAVDSLTPLLYPKLFEEEAAMLDLGTGAGLPGIPLYIVRGPLDMTLLEPVRKKNSFLRHIRRKLGLESLNVLSMRSEELCRSEENLNGYERVFMRAVTDHAQAAKLARPLLSSGGMLILFLGKDAAEALSRKGKDPGRLGLRLDNLRSTRKVTGKDTHLAILRKAE